MATPVPTPPKTPLSVKPLSREAKTVSKKRAFVPLPHLTQRPFSALASLMETSTD